MIFKDKLSEKGKVVLVRDTQADQTKANTNFMKDVRNHNMYVNTEGQNHQAFQVWLAAHVHDIQMAQTKENTHQHYNLWAK